MAIPQQFLDDLINRIDIVDLIDSRVPLKKAGKEYVACCPFHSEKSPSFSVAPHKQFYHCFGCQAHGNVITFIMEYDNVGFVDAVDELAKSVGLEIPRDAKDNAQKVSANKEIYEVLEKAASWFRAQLEDHNNAQVAISYMKERGLSGDVAKKFSVGYAPPGWDNIMKALGNTPEKLELLLKAGLIIKKDNGDMYDRFRDRIMFPIRDRRGRVVAFGGRVFDDTVPKYLNSPETDVFHKGQELYGFYEAIQTNKRPDRLLVVEGYMDVAMLAQNEIDYAVAALGTATSKEHIQRLFRTAPEIVFCFDGDKAGRAAAWRALEAALPSIQDGKEIFFMFLPEGEDPDTLIQKIGSIEFEDMICDDVTPLPDFFFNELSKGIDAENSSGKARLFELVKPLMNKIPKNVFREMMVQQLGRLIKTDESKINSMMFGIDSKPEQTVSQYGPKNNYGKKKKRYISKEEKERQGYHVPSSPDEQKVNKTAQRTAISLLLSSPEMAIELILSEEINESKVPGDIVLCDIVKAIKENNNINAAQIIERWRGKPEAAILAELAREDIEAPKESLKTELSDAINKINAQVIEIRVNDLFGRMANLNSDEKEELKRLADRQHELESGP